MPYEIRWEPAGVHWKYTGRLTGQDILQSNLQIYGDARFDDLKYQIVDLLDIDAIDAEPSHIKKVAYLDVAAARTNPGIKVAVVTERDTLKEWAQMYAEYSDASPWETMVFGNVEEARAWVAEETSQMGD